MNVAEAPAREGRACRLGRLKMHLRVLRLAGRVYRLVTPRPDFGAVFSTNFYHQTWHIVSDQHGARMLARLLWGLSFQRQPGTLVLVHGRHLRPTPFEAERSDPFLLVPSPLTPVDARAFRELKGRLGSLGQPDQTIRWHTFGLDLAVGDHEEARRRAEAEREMLSHSDGRGLWRQEQMRRCGGLICYSAPPPVLRQRALGVHALRVGPPGSAADMDYFFLAEAPDQGRGFPDGEVQIFADYRDRVGAAVEARRQLLPNPNQPVLDESLQWDISRKRDAITQRKAAGRRKRTSHAREA